MATDSSTVYLFCCHQSVQRERHFDLMHLHRMPEEEGGVRSSGAQKTSVNIERGTPDFWRASVRRLERRTRVTLLSSVHAARYGT